MGDSDSDDELMMRLTRMARGDNNSLLEAEAEECASCGAMDATLPCQMCHAVLYCNEMCLRRHGKAHRAYCITVRMQDMSDDESIDSSSDEESEEEEEDTQVDENTRQNRSSKLSHSMISSKSSKSGRVRLSKNQIKRLMELSNGDASQETTRDAVASISHLKEQIAHFMSIRQSEDENANRRSTVTTEDLEELQRKLDLLEERTQKLQERKEQEDVVAPPASAPTLGSGAMLASYGSATSMRESMMMGVRPKFYRPLLVKEDEEFRRFFKLKDLDMPLDQIKRKMEEEGIDVTLLDRPDDVSPNDPGPAEDEYVPMTVAEDPMFQPYFKLKRLDMPLAAIHMKMEAEGVDPDLLSHPGRPSPNDPGLGRQPKARRPAYNPMTIAQDPVYAKYMKLKQMGMPMEHIQMKMERDGVGVVDLDRPDDASPNDPGPPKEPIARDESSPVSIQKLYDMVMEQQAIIQQVSRGNIVAQTTTTSRQSVSADPTPNEGVSSESAVAAIFGSEDAPAPSSKSGLIEELERQARRKENKKLVEKRDDIRRFFTCILTTEFEDDEHAMRFYVDISRQLEDVGLLLGAEEQECWSNRLHMRSRDTNTKYFSDDDRQNAARAYNRLWSLSFLQSTTSQLQDKHDQLVQAPTTLRATATDKSTLVLRFRELLKEAVQLRHKVFKNALFEHERRKLGDERIPERFDDRGQELMNAAIPLAHAALGFVQEERVAMEKIVRGKRQHAANVSRLAEQVLNFVQIVGKVGATAACDECRVSEVEAITLEMQQHHVEVEEEDVDLV